MYNANPNQRHNLMQPRQFHRSPMQPGVTNPYHYGFQRMAGRMAVQPNAGYAGPNNSLPRRFLRLPGY